MVTVNKTTKDPRIRRTLQGVLVFAPTFPPAFKGGGPSRSLDAFVANAPDQFSLAVIAPSVDLGDSELMNVETDKWLTRGAARVWYADVRKWPDYFRALAAARSERPTVLYLNSFFNSRMSIFPNILSLFGFWGSPRLRRVLAPRGEFGAGALSRRSLKKRVFIRVFRILRLDRGLVWHATADHEVNDIKALWGEDAHVLLRANETLLPATAIRPVFASELLQAVFLGRHVEHKGLHIVLQALQGSDASMALNVYGSEEDASYAAECRELARSVPPNIKVTFFGPVPSDDVTTILSAHDVMLMPTAGENFGHVIAEALSVSCAVTTTTETPWTDVLIAGGGVVVSDRFPSSWAAAVKKMQSLDGMGRQEMRMRAASAYDNWSARERQSHLLAELTDQHEPTD